MSAVRPLRPGETVPAPQDPLDVEVEPVAVEDVPAAAERVALKGDPSPPDTGRGDMRMAVAVVVVVSLLLIVGAAIGFAVAPRLSP